MTDETKRTVRAQFGRQARWYTASAVHRGSASLGELLRLSAPLPEARALDVATGTGFTGLALAARCRQVVGVDLTPDMVREARRLAADRGVPNFLLCLGDAEALPFPDRAFDVVACRHAAHHFPDFPRALAEMGRVAKIGVRVVLDDTCAPENPALARAMNEWELRRDPSHVTNRPPSELVALVDQSGLRVEAAVMTQVPLEFADWVRRSGVAAAEAAALRASLLGASADARSAFRIRLEGDTLRFAWDEIVILGVKR